MKGDLNHTLVPLGLVVRMLVVFVGLLFRIFVFSFACTCSYVFC